MPKKEKVYTDEQLRRRVRRIRSLMSVFAPSMTRGAKRRVGRELFLDTDEGSVRVLAYNLENPEKLPLFVNIHGSGFVLGGAEMDDPFLHLRPVPDMNIQEPADSFSFVTPPDSAFP